ncbi:MAG: nuclear transport factor 2 family protein [Phycisphaerales bacterium]|nr:MAG: nuclear transport factor 2 family protein [Phycisphaerales bacterium]
MPLPNEELMQRYADAGHRGDIDTVLECYADDIVMHVPGRNPLAGDYHGKQGVLNYTKRFIELTGGTWGVTQVVDVFANERRGLLLLKVWFERPGKRVEVSRVDLYRIENAKLAEIWISDDDQYAVDEFFT